jgi:cytochrome c oxidase assembly protein subunit 15
MTELTRADRSVGIWLLACAAAVLIMVVLGGVTRLTHSGLSITQWQPLAGVLPPLDDAGWTAEFERYQQFPEYQQVNRGMSLAGFKSIYWFEYAHRLLGRLIGVVFLLPLLYFLAKGYVRRALAPKLVVVFLLGAAQGAMGWFMVKSGLVDMPRVSHFRLTAHLALAVMIYGYMLWIAFGLLQPTVSVPAAGRLSMHARAIAALLFVMILTGGLVAGTRAGLLFGTFPLMGDSFVPAGLYAASFWTAATQDPVTIQFNHRLLAYVLVALVLWFGIRARGEDLAPGARRGVHALIALVALQVALGICTILYRVPVELAAAHQGVAMLLFGSALYVSHALRGSPAAVPQTRYAT